MLLSMVRKLHIPMERSCQTNGHGVAVGAVHRKKVVAGEVYNTMCAFAHPPHLFIPCTQSLPCLQQCFSWSVYARCSGNTGVVGVRRCAHRRSFFVGTRAAMAASFPIKPCDSLSGCITAQLGPDTSPLQVRWRLQTLPSSAEHFSSTLQNPWQDPRKRHPAMRSCQATRLDVP